MGNAYGRQGAYAQAIEAFQKAVEIKPDNHEAWNNMGVAYEKQSDYTKAIEAYQKAVEIKPDLHEAWTNMGLVYEKQGNYSKAIEAYQKALAINEASGALTGLGWLYFILKDKDNAKQYFEREVQVNEDHDAALMNLGHIALIEGSREQAMDLYRQSIAKFPNKQNFFAGFEDDWQYMEAYGVDKEVYFGILEDLKTEQ